LRAREVGASPNQAARSEPLVRTALLNLRNAGEPPRRTRWHEVRPSVTVKVMGTALKGTVHGRTIELDHQVERLDGQRVLVVLEPIDGPAPSAREAADAWRTWAERGPDGPIEDDGEASFP
jgi:hypothetical protein